MLSVLSFLMSTCFAKIYDFRKAISFVYSSMNVRINPPFFVLRSKTRGDKFDHATYVTYVP